MGWREELVILGSRLWVWAVEKVLFLLELFSMFILRIVICLLICIEQYQTHYCNYSRIWLKFYNLSLLKIRDFICKIGLVFDRIDFSDLPFSNMLGWEKVSRLWSVLSLFYKFCLLF